MGGLGKFNVDIGSMCRSCLLSQTGVKDKRKVFPYKCRHVLAVTRIVEILAVGHANL